MAAKRSLRCVLQLSVWCVCGFSPVVANNLLAAEEFVETTITASALARSHAATWAKLERIDVLFDLEEITLSDSKPVVSKGNLWRRSQTGERLRIRNLDGNKTVVDRYVEGGRIRQLTYDLADEPAPRRLAKPAAGSFRGSIEPGDASVFDQTRPPNFERCAKPLPSGELREVSWVDYFAERSAKVEKTYVEDGDRKTAVEIPAQAVSEPGTREEPEIVVFNITKGSVVEEAQRRILDEDGKTVLGELRFRVEAWLAPEPGLWYPKVCARRVRLADKIGKETVLVSKWTTTHVATNRRLQPDDRLDFEFPENLVVEDSTDKKRGTRILLWGPFDEPQADFATRKELDEYWKSRPVVEPR
jgi:hypothetical protein